MSSNIQVWHCSIQEEKVWYPSPPDESRPQLFEWGNNLVGFLRKDSTMMEGDLFQTHRLPCHNITIFSSLLVFPKFMS